MFNKYPYSDVHEINLDWVIDVCRKAESQLTAIGESVSDVLERWKNDGTLSDIIDKNTPKGITLCFGDSYLEGITAGGRVLSWGDALDNIGYNVRKYARGGSGFLVSNEGVNFDTLLSNAINDNNYNHGDVSSVIMAAGYNDNPSNVGDLIMSIDSWCKRAKSAFPNATVYLAYIATRGTRGAFRTMQNLNAYLYSYSSAVNLGDLSSCLIKYDGTMYVSSDKIHPTQVGYTRIANAIHNAINGNHMLGCFYNLSFTSDGTGFFFLSAENGRCTLHTLYHQFSIPSGQTCDGDKVNFTISDTRPFFKNLDRHMASVTIPVVIVRYGTNFVNGFCEISFNDGVAEFRLTGVKADGSGYVDDCRGFFTYSGNYPAWSTALF